MRSLIAAALVLMPAVALADPAGIHVEHAWSRAMPAGATGVVYLTITDQGAPNALTGVASPVAAKAELHETIDDHGVMKMRPVARLAVTPAKPATLAPGGYHIMLMGLKRELVAGTSFPITLTFAKGGHVMTMVSVEKAGAAMPGMDHGNMGSMGNMSGSAGSSGGGAGSMGSTAGGTGNMDMHGMSMGGAGSK